MRPGVVGMCVVTLGVVLILCLAAGAVGAGDVGSGYPGVRSKPRTIRGFKNVALSTARGFGKRANSALEFFPGSVYNEEQTSPDRSPTESLPVEWFAQELQSNPELARMVINTFIDTNQDGVLTTDELLRPAATN